MVKESSTLEINDAFIEYFRCPEVCATFALRGDICPGEGYFRFGPELICYGQSSLGYYADSPAQATCDLMYHIRTEGQTCHIPFKPSEVVRNLLEERYVRSTWSNGRTQDWMTLLHKAYYAIRPPLKVPVRKHLQRLWLRGWEKKYFPSWPVDRTVDLIMERLLLLAMKAQGVDRIPFIWFWPEGHSSCVILTHDVEESAGVGFCSQLMDIDHSFGIGSSFQFIPEHRYSVLPSLINKIRERGFEVNVHDLNHDGHLYDDREQFLRRAFKINRYANEWRATGFRAGSLYRNLDWYDAFEFSYDMSVPNVGHLDPWPGGCCTVMPYFVGKILELPLTTTQDYSLFNVIGDYSIELWKRQIALIAEGNGLISFNVHPDYVVEKKARETYLALLKYLSEFRSTSNVWFALPGEVDRWWRDRSQMNVIKGVDGKWCIEGTEEVRARIAYARLAGDRVMYTIEEPGRERE